MGRREDNKRARRARILEAAARLLEERGADGLSVRELAREAEVSEMTLYNLFGSKSAIVLALFEASVDEIVAQGAAEPSTEPLDGLLAAQRSVAETWTHESGRFRELFRAAREAGADLAPFRDYPLDMLTRSIERLARARLISDAVAPVDLARNVVSANQGVQEAWLVGGLDDASLRRDLMLNLLLPMLGVAKPKMRKRILTLLETL